MIAAPLCSPVTRPGGSPPILRSSLRRCPTMPTPRSCKSSAVRLGRTGCRRLIPAERRLILTKAQAWEPRSDSMVAPLLVMAHDCASRTAFQANSWPDNSRSGSVMREWRALPLASSPTKHGRARKTHQRPPLSEAPLGDLIGSADGMVLPLAAQTEQPCERIDSGLDG
jgi:hypothetical protein